MKKRKKISEINPFNLKNLIQRKKQIKKKKQEEEDNLYNQFIEEKIKLEMIQIFNF